MSTENSKQTQKIPKIEEVKEDLRKKQHERAGQKVLASPEALAKAKACNSGYKYGCNTLYDGLGFESRHSCRLAFKCEDAVQAARDRAAREAAEAVAAEAVAAEAAKDEAEAAPSADRKLMFPRLFFGGHSPSGVTSAHAYGGRGRGANGRGLVPPQGPHSAPRHPGGLNLGLGAQAMAAMAQGALEDTPELPDPATNGGNKTRKQRTRKQRTRNQSSRNQSSRKQRTRNQRTRKQRSRKQKNKKSK